MGEPTHDVTLQRLDVDIPQGDKDVFFSRSSFVNTADWNNIPVIYIDESAKELRHPTNQEVASGNLPEGMRIAGSVVSANIPEQGQARLDGRLAITDPAVDKLANAGLLGLSTGFNGNTLTVDGHEKIVGRVAPYHVLVFKQGANSSFFPRDNGALFLNMRTEEEPTMEDSEFETKAGSLFEKLFAKKLEAFQAKTFGEMTEQINGVTADRDALQVEMDALTAKIAEKDARIAELEGAENQRILDAAWATAKAKCPEGWLGEKEAETRALFESNKDQFYGNLMEHTMTFGNLKAEGSVTTTAPAADPLQAYIEEQEQKAGYKF